MHSWWPAVHLSWWHRLPGPAAATNTVHVARTVRPLHKYSRPPGTDPGFELEGGLVERRKRRYYGAEVWGGGIPLLLGRSNCWGDACSRMVGCQKLV